MGPLETTYTLNAYGGDVLAHKYVDQYWHLNKSISSWACDVMGDP